MPRYAGVEMTGKSRTKTEERELDSLLTSKSQAGIKTEGRSQPKADMAVEVRTPSVKARMAFLEAVVRDRETVSQRFKDWFPDFSNGDLSLILAGFYPRMKLPFWHNRNVDEFKPSPDDRQSYEGMFRHKLRIIWRRANSDGNPKPAVIRLLTETREFLHLMLEVRRAGGTKEADVRWFVNTSEALEWLERNTHKLRLCAIEDCKHPYFIVTPSRKKYCSDYCQEVAEVERSRERVRIEAEKKKAAVLSGQVAKPSRLTPEGRERIVRAVKRRWEQRRRGKGRSKKS
jgi:hypothetical protein